MPTQDAQIYRLKAEYRRCGIYVWLGSIACFALALAVAPIVQQGPKPGPPPAEMTVIMGLLVVTASVFCLILWKWRLRVDREGIARRRLRRWHVWPWEAFRSGAVKQGRSIGYYLWSEAAWTWRGLLLELIEEADAKEVDALIKKIWVAPAQEELPEEVRFRVLLTKVCLDAQGLAIRRGHTERCYPWKDIDRIVITRLEHDRGDFLRLIIELPEKPLELFLHQGNPNWSGAEATLIARWLTTHAPPERVLEVARTGSPRSIAEAEYQLATCERDQRKFRLGKRWIVALALVPFAAALAKPMMLIFAGGYSLLFYAYWRLCDEHQERSRKRERELLDWLASHEEQAQDQSNA